MQRWPGRRTLPLLGACAILLTGGLGGALVAAATPAPAATPAAPGGAWWADAVCYEVFVRSSFDSDGDGIGDLNGLIQKLDYLNDGDPRPDGPDLGVDCLSLTPVFESPSDHGFDVVDSRRVDREYGTNDDFERLVAEAHERGIIATARAPTARSGSRSCRSRKRSPHPPLPSRPAI